MPQGYRPDRVADQIRAEISVMLAREVHDPGIGFLTITRVQVVAGPAARARLLHDPRHPSRSGRPTAKALQRATPFLRRQVGQRLQLRRVPVLEFFFDKSVENQERVERLLQRDPRGRREGRSRGRPANRTMTLSATRTDHAEVLREIREEILRAQRFLITSHLKPDGDSIGSQMAMAYALRALGKEVRLVNRDQAAAGPARVPRRVGDRDRRPRSTATTTSCS